MLASFIKSRQGVRTAGRESVERGAHRRLLGLPLLASAAVLLGGCSMLEPQYESTERESLGQVGESLGIAAFTGESAAQGSHGGHSGHDGSAANSPLWRGSIALPVLDENATAQDYERFALLNHPRVYAAFYRWWAQVEAITPARSLPDPMLTFQADITDMLMSVMPGIMFEIPAWGKLEAMGKEAAAGARAAYREYVMALYETQTQLLMAWAQLRYSEQMLLLAEQSVQVLGQSVSIAGADYGTGRGMGSLQMQAEQMNARDKAVADLENLRDALELARVRFKAALGLGYADPAPFWPQEAFPAPAPASAEELWQQIAEGSPRLQALREMAAMATAQIAMAHTEGRPHFEAGVMVDTKSTPLMYRPEFKMTLPIWRDKIAAVIASAQAQELAAQADLGQAELELAAELAESLLMLRQSERLERYVRDVALPGIERARISADAGYRSGGGDFGSIASLRLMELQMKQDLAMAERDRSLSLAEIAMLTAGELAAPELLVRQSASQN